MVPTPAGQRASADAAKPDAKPFSQASNSRSSTQGNLMAGGSGGHSPAWFGSKHGRHGASASALSLGHLIHSVDNHRDSVRGEGFELHTDAYGAIRAAQGVHLSTHATHSSEPAGDHAPGMALMRQLGTLGQSFHKMASTHQRVALTFLQNIFDNHTLVCQRKVYLLNRPRRLQPKKLLIQRGVFHAQVGNFEALDSPAATRRSQ